MNNIIDKFFKTENKDASEISVPLEKELYGVKIRKLTNGAYIKALNTVQNLPGIIIKGCFPGQDLEDILKYFQTISVENIIFLAGKLLATMPEHFLKLISELLDIPFEKLRDDLTPKETLEILEAFWKVNDIDPFFEILKRTVKTIVPEITNKN
jgi:predicted transcriptional regulator